MMYPYHSIASYQASACQADVEYGLTVALNCQSVPFFPAKGNIHIKALKTGISYMDERKIFMGS